MSKNHAIAATAPAPSAASAHHLTWLLLLSAAIIVFLTGPAMATNTPMGAVVCGIVSFFYGNLGQGLASLAVIVVGVGATMGKVSWGLAITVACGISVIFNAPNFVGYITGVSGC